MKHTRMGAGAPVASHGLAAAQPPLMSKLMRHMTQQPQLHDKAHEAGVCVTVWVIGHSLAISDHSLV